jgi:hypothetical protein
MAGRTSHAKTTRLGVQATIIPNKKHSIALMSLPLPLAD